MKINFQADDVRLNVSKDARGNLAPSLASARNGSVLVEMARGELEAALLAFSKAAAAEQGVNVESVDLTVGSAGGRAVQGSVRVKAKKGFIPATVDVSGRADVDERLNVTVSNLSCTGEGMIGSLVAGMIKAKLQPFEGRKFPLAGTALQNVWLNSLKVDAGDPLRVTAAFES